MPKKEPPITEDAEKIKSKNIVLHILRNRTKNQDSILEALEYLAKKQGITMASLVLVKLSADKEIRARIGSK